MHSLFSSSLVAGRVHTFKSRRCFRISHLQPQAMAEDDAPSASGNSRHAPLLRPLEVDPANVDVAAVAQKWDWDLEKRPNWQDDKQVMELPVAVIRRPFAPNNNPEKVAALMKSIQEIGQQEPIDVLEVEGQYYGFSGCHRFEAHLRLGKETILCKVRKANRQVLKYHMM